MLLRRFLGWTVAVATLVVVPSLIGPAASTVVSAQASASGEVTFAKDIAPILQRSCQNCHRPEWRRADVADHL